MISPQRRCMEAINYCTTRCEMFFISCSSAVRRFGNVWGVGDSSRAHADPEHPIDVLLGLDPANGLAKVMQILPEEIGKINIGLEERNRPVLVITNFTAVWAPVF